MSFYDSIKRELIYVTCIARTLMLTHRVGSDARVTVNDWIERHAHDRPGSPAVLYQDRTVSYRELNDGANRYARWALANRVVKGEVVALLMENRPEYLMAWLGLTRMGAVAALINTHLVGHPLAHSIAIAGAKHLVLGAELADNYAGVVSTLDVKPKLWATGGRVAGAEDLDADLAGQSAGPIDAAVRNDIFGRDKALYIYTSGTTGLPKAANISHMRVLHIMAAFQGAVNAKPSDRMYNVLPLYHSAGGICALGPVILGGGSVVVREKFSASEFWDDCYRYKPTLFQYIGELCRYLLNTPEAAHERENSLRIAIGNGLRAEIWPKFQQRFRIPLIMEFYGATEGNVGMINYDGKVGSIGRVPWYARAIQKIRLIRYDIEKQEAVRGADGFCIETADGEAGEAIGEINPNVARLRFDGYTNKAETQKKILNDTFAKGDAWFRTGDLMKRDAQSYFYFVDRTGDTFRWKGENVATSEVEEALSVFAGVKEVNVYGVAVPGEEGKAGMAAITSDKELDLAALAGHLEKNLPAYARPVFLRFPREIETTSTFKVRKIDLVSQGYDPTAIPDPLYLRDPRTGRYARLDAKIYDDIQSGRVSL